MQIGDSATYVDPTGKRRAAVVTAVFDNPDISRMPSINVVYVSDDDAKHDQYGRQIERQTSVPHHAQQAAHGNYWL